MKFLKMNGKARIGVLSLLLATLFFSCSESDDVKTIEGKGRLNVAITDAPFPIDIVDKTVVTIDKVEIAQTTQASEDEAETRTFITLSEEEYEINLLDLANGVTAQLASVDLEAGSYDQIRLHVVDAKVILKDGTEFDLTIPSGSTSGLKVKIEPAVVIEEGTESSVLLDFDVSKSFVMQGNMNTPAGIKGFHFKPVVRAVFVGFAGQVEGHVNGDAEAILENAHIELWSLTETQEADTVVTSAFSDEAGFYKMIGLPEGTYHLSAAMENYDTIWVDNVAVEAGQTTTVDLALTPVEEEAAETTEE